MRRAPSIAAVLLCLAGGMAYATVTGLNFPGVPVDVSFSDAGRFAVATDAGYFFVERKDAGYYVADGSLGAASGANGFVAAYIADPCLNAYDEQSFAYSCGAEATPKPNWFTVPISAAQEPLYALRWGGDGSAYAIRNSSGVVVVSYQTPGVGWGTQFDSIFVSDPPYSSLSVIDFNGGTYALGHISGDSFFLAANGVGGPTTVSHDLASAAPAELALYARNDGNIGLLVATNSGVASWIFPTDAGWGTNGLSTSITTTRLPQLGSSPIGGLAFSGVTGGDGGASGFGMAEVLSPAQLYGAIPDPAAPAATWQHRNQEFDSTLISRILCEGARRCVLLKRSTSTGPTFPNVYIYENDSAPEVADASWTVSESRPATLSVTATDPDDDPVFLAWSAPDGGLALRSLNPSGTAVDAGYVGPLLCGTPRLSVPVDIIVGDGLAEHTWTVKGTAEVRHDIPPEPPRLPVAVVIPAGTAAQTITPLPGLTGCAPDAYAWVETVSTTPHQVEYLDGGSALFTPPATACGDRTVTFDVSAIDSSSAAPDSGWTPLTVTVQAWGLPDAAFEPDAGAFQDAGTAQSYSAHASHPCALVSSNFPGVDTTWTFDPSQIDGGEVRVDGGLATSPVVADAVSLSVPDCREGTFVFHAKLQTLGDGGLTGPDSTLSVQVSTHLLAVQDASVDLNASSSPGSFRVTGTVGSNANCPGMRGLQADVRVLDPSNGDAGVQILQVPGPFGIAIPPQCAGGTYQVSATLRDNSGTGRTATASIDLQSTPAGIVPFPDGGTLLAQCGAAAAGTVTAVFPQDACPAPDLRWSWVSGQPIEPLGSGNPVMVTTQAQSFDALGETVTLRATADAGLGSVATADQTLQIVTNPFVEVKYATDAPIVEESGILGVRVELSNPTGCDVGSVSYRETLDGMAFVPGSARLDGQPIPAIEERAAIVVSGISLRANGRAVLTYSARPALLGRPRPSGQASVKGVAISGIAGLQPPPPACGCSSGPDALAAGLGALALRALLRRRRLSGRS